MPVVENDPFGNIKSIAKPNQGPEPELVNKIHARSDVDTSVIAQHHSLGIKANQSSPGDHKHDGRNSKKLMEGITITGAKGGNVALTNLITQLSNVLGFTDATT